MTKLFTIVKRQGIIGLWLLLILGFSLASESFFTAQNLVNILIQASTLTIIAVGMTFVLLSAGIDLSFGSIMFLAGVAAGMLTTRGVGLGVAVPTILIIGLLFGLLNGLLIVRLRLIPFIVTLATFYMGRGLGLLLSDTRAINLPEAILQIGSSRILGVPVPVWIMILVVLIGHLILSRTVFGRYIYAVGHSKEKAAKAGLPVNRILIGTYAMGGLCAGVGGLVAIAQLGAVSPSFGLQSEFLAIAAAVLGGTSLFGGKGGIFPGTVVGAFTMQTIQNGLVIVNADPYLHQLVTGAVIFLIVWVDSRQNAKKKSLSLN
ncbi:MAG: ABC transporter permease [Bacteroidota bacterium]